MICKTRIDQRTIMIWKFKKKTVVRDLIRKKIQKENMTVPIKKKNIKKKIIKKMIYIKKSNWTVVFLITKND